jgi:ribosomal protein S18 acetylase RimI-like enzyme
MQPVLIRCASATDVAAVVQLVNQAYRPATGLGGWTHEAEWVGGLRTNREQVLALLDMPHSQLLLGVRNDKLVACVHVEQVGTLSYIGMLAVNPLSQTHGVGKQMLAAAEAYACAHFAPHSLLMQVLSSRSELIEFYQRRGYQLSGEHQEYPLTAGVGVPLIGGLTVLTLYKRIAAGN